ncbi:MAG: ABC transporter ATP-binding protein [Gammaproteobacteria bacterium]|nr:ABC transporter ATP-binding protein [Gammaproteobacteria bacterium]NNM20513.1 ABC transporter ATP-binding protein [Gammaproteobacteria bacterium]
MIELQAVDRIFEVGDEHVHALDQVNLAIEAGEYLSIMGPSGSGKSTLLNLIGLLDRPTAGSYLLDGRNTTEMDDAEQAHTRGEKIGFVFQAFHLVSRLTAAENVELPMVLAGIVPSQRRERVERALASMDLTDRAGHRPDQLSGGQRQRVAIARATVMGPNVLLADEPTGNLDTRSGEEVVEVLEQLNHEGITLIIVTHDQDLGRRARRRLHMVDGRIVEDISSQQTPA